MIHFFDLPPVFAVLSSSKAGLLLSSILTLGSWWESIAQRVTFQSEAFQFFLWIQFTFACFPGWLIDDTLRPYSNRRSLVNFDKVYKYFPVLAVYPQESFIVGWPFWCWILPLPRGFLWSLRWVLSYWSNCCCCRLFFLQGLFFSA